MSRFQIGLLVVLGVIATVAAGVFSQGGPAAPEAAPVAEEVAAPDAQAEAEAEAARVAAEEEAARVEAERLAAEAAAQETAWVVSAPLAAPELSVVRSGVGIYDADADEDAQPREIAEAEQAPVPTGGRVIVPARGMAVLDWGGALRGELLRAASVTVAESDLDQRRVALDQSDGTVRYLMSMPGEEGPVGMTVAAGSVVVDSDTSHGDMADLLITHVPDPEATEDDAGDGGRTWVVVVAGAADVEFGGPVAAAGESAGERKVRLEAGQGAAFAAAGEAPTVMPMDLVAVETWYGQMLSGYRDSIAAFAFRCVITADEVALRAKPPTGGQIQTSAAAARAIASLSNGTLVNVTHRTEDSLWLEVDAPELEEPAWMEAGGVQCIAPVASVPIIDKAYLAPATATPAVVAVSFAGAEPEITAGKCTMLRWDVPSGSQITVDGKPMPGKGFQSVCPDRTTSYTLRWVDANGQPRERRVTVVVNEAPEQVALADTDGGEDSDGSSGGIGGLLDPDSPEPEPTICIGPECEVILPAPEPTRTRRPRPTAAPAEPTDPPAAPNPTDPPAGPQPTDPPSGPEPTDPPAVTATVTATVAVTNTATATATATATTTETAEPAPTETPAAPDTPSPVPTATLEPPTQTPEPPATPTPEPPATATPLALRDGAVS
jgi:hypothetical protein